MPRWLQQRTSAQRGFEAFGRTCGEADKVPLGSWGGDEWPMLLSMLMNNCNGIDRKEQKKERKEEWTRKSERKKEQREREREVRRAGLQMFFPPWRSKIVTARFVIAHRWARAKSQSPAVSPTKLVLCVRVCFSAHYVRHFNFPEVS